jgi:hypothetical protein
LESSMDHIKLSGLSTGYLRVLEMNLKKYVVSNRALKRLVAVRKELARRKGAGQNG